MDIRIDRGGDTTVIAPVGDVDLSTSRELQHAIREAMDAQPDRLVVDLGAVPYMDSSGVATLVEAMQIVRKASSTLVLCAMQDKVRSIFEIARLDRVFTIVPDLDAAKASG